MAAAGTLRVRANMVDLMLPQVDVIEPGQTIGEAIDDDHFHFEPTDPNASNDINEYVPPMEDETTSDE